MTKRAKLLQKLRAVSSGGASFSDVVTLLEAYGFRRNRVSGSHWFFVYTDQSGNHVKVGFAVVNGKLVKVPYVKRIVEKIDSVRDENED